ncbi:agamous-like mads-box protein agl62 [Phtheirospermum japonicum]|uniref:Agamous-like mads-box protein agl62 n=1 Tax=Phtheirospermum japonicum TaxID=374723 RepID=A0A830DAD2_9LAMI|nr:agamous-like mads-box protein agl62 [Phtheirospermum japonicum]
MVKIENEKSLQVTFSKRRAGLFKKASELGTLCHAETAVVVFSPGNRAHSFGHPSVQAISNRFLNENNPPMSYAEKLLEDYHKANVSRQTLELNQVERQLELEQKRTNELKQARKDGSPEINKLDYNQLFQLKGALLNLRHGLEAKVKNGSAQSSYVNINGKLIVGGSSAPINYVGGGICNSNMPNVITPYDLVADDLCPIIPYSSSATSFDINPNSGCGL